MTFEELTWNQDCWDEDKQAHMGWQAQWEAPNGYLCVVDAQVSSEPLASATEAGQLYNFTIVKWDRSSHDGDASYDPQYSFNEGLQPSEVTTKLAEAEAIPQPAPEVDPNEVEDPPVEGGQWD